MLSLCYFNSSMTREMPLLELEEKYSKLKSLKKARTCWENEFRVSSKQVRDTSKCYFVFAWIHANNHVAIHSFHLTGNLVASFYTHTPHYFHFFTIFLLHCIIF